RLQGKFKVKGWVKQSSRQVAPGQNISKWDKGYKDKTYKAESVEPIDELSKETLGGYIKGAASDWAKKEGEVDTGHRGWKKMARKLPNRKRGIDQAVDRLKGDMWVKNQNRFWRNAEKTSHYTKDYKDECVSPGAAGIKAAKADDAERDAIKKSGKKVPASLSGKHSKGYYGNYYGKYYGNYYGGDKKESVEPIDELSGETLTRYTNKAQGDPKRRKGVNKAYDRKQGRFLTKSDRKWSTGERVKEWRKYNKEENEHLDEAILDSKTYRWWKYQGADRRLMYRAKVPHVLHPGDTFGMRQAHSNPEKIRLVVDKPGYGISKVFSISKEEAYELAGHAQTTMREGMFDDDAGTKQATADWLAGLASKGKQA
ncbi:MAG TPA: hypothetical protein VIJ93_12690, partial [bacterium]